MLAADRATQDRQEAQHLMRHAQQAFFVAADQL